MNTAVAQTRNPIQQDIRHYVPRWMRTLACQLTGFGRVPFS